MAKIIGPEERWEKDAPLSQYGPISQWHIETVRPYEQRIAELEALLREVVAEEFDGGEYSYTGKQDAAGVPLMERIAATLRIEGINKCCGKEEG